MSSPATAEVAAPPSTTLQPTITLTKEDCHAQVTLYTLLIQETKHLGNHGATPHRRAAAGRVELQLIALRDQLTPHLAH
jgi:hypothetical protein